MFEAKTIQRMEVLVLSTLEWKMNPVTPLSFLDCITSRLGLKSYIGWEFHKNCESLVLSIIAGKIDINLEKPTIFFLCEKVKTFLLIYICLQIVGSCVIFLL